LVSAPGAPPRPRPSTGLFHLAVLVPTRADLAVALRRVAAAGGRLSGASDHLVSEALYLDDPEGNGIEIYRDRPRNEWRRSGGELEMATLPLDLDGVLAAAPRESDGEHVPEGTRIGHVHLEVSALAPVEDFYAGVLGLDVTVRGYPGALFVSAGGYHHHVGLNTWQGAGAPPPPPGALGLDRFELLLPDTAERDVLAERVGARDGIVTDPSGNSVMLAAAG
jgi:catechol 2,3-dioxygenase